jgi:hypothetical protein
MTRLLNHAAVVAASLLVLPAVARGQNRTFEKTVPLEAGATLTLVSHKGGVTLMPWDRDEVEIRARIEAPDGVSADYAKRAVEATGIDVTGDRRALRIAPDYDRVPTEGTWFGGDSRTIPPIYFEIRAPKRLDVRLDLDRSETKLGAFEGRFDIESDRSNIEAANLAGALRLEVDRGDRVRFGPIAGSIDVTADRSEVEIAFTRLDGDSRVEVDRGSVEVRLAPSQGVDLRADIERRGDFSSDFPVTTSGRIGERIEGTINGGGPRLTLHSERARVELRKAG